MVTQLARLGGAYVIGTGRLADRQSALDFGANEFIDLDNEAWKTSAEWIRCSPLRGAAVVFSCLAKDLTML